MIIKYEKPPNYELISKSFDIPYEAVFTYGNVLYVPNGGEIDQALMKHEETHMSQQEKLGKDVWWNYYIKSRDFRLSQEVEAYQNQYAEKKKLTKDRNELNRYLNRLAMDLSSPMYGKIMTLTEARQAIRSLIPIRFDVRGLMK